ncbi:MAG: LamG-like jellyroll fold domain-containing protein [Verrucomicrobiota bacterium]
MKTFAHVRFIPTICLVPTFFSLLVPVLFGQGINQATFTPAEIGTEIFQFPNEPAGLTEETVGLQPTIIDFQHGELHITAGRDGQGGEVALTWWDLSDPRNPTFITKRELPFGNKPHSITFWDDRFVTGHQGARFRIWDYLTKTELATHQAATSPVWWTVQAPYVYRPTNGYGTAANNLEVLDFTDIMNVSQLNLVDLNQLVGFYIGATHPVGNLLLCSAGQAQGVAVLDISDPANPVLLSSTPTVGNVYTSIVHGTRLYTGERGDGIGVYNFADPTNIVSEGLVPLTQGGDARYVVVKENIGWSAPQGEKLYKFNALTRQIIDVYNLVDGSDFVFPLGNMILTGGNKQNNRCAIIAVDQNPDTQGPVVGMVSPLNGATGQHVLSRVGLVMSDQIDVTSLNATNWIVRPVGGAALSGTYSTQMGMVNFVPDLPLEVNTTYEVIVPEGGIRDVVGNGAREAFYSTFSTGGSIDVDAGLTGHYRLDESAGFVAADSSPGGNDGALTNFSGTPWIAGTVGEGALQFDGIDDWVNLVNGSHLETAFNHRTVALWARADLLSGIQVLYEEGGGSNGYVLRLNGTTLEARAKAGATIFDLSAPFPADGGWHHLAATYDRDGDFTLYLDGIVVETVSTGGVRIPAHGDNPGLGARNNADPFGGTTVDHFFAGALDDVRIYELTLDTTQITRLRSLAEGFIGHWTFNSSAEDESAGGNDGVLTNGASLSTDSAQGPQSLLLDGTNDFVDCGTFDVGPRFTASAWVKVPSASSLGLETILGNCGSGFVADGFKLFIYGTSNATNAGRIQLETGNGTNGNAANTAPGTFSFDEWNHVAVIVDRLTGEARIFCNGVDATVDSTIRTDFATSQSFDIGQMTNGSNELSGNIDDVRLYNRLLSTGEVRRLSIEETNGQWRLDNDGLDLSGFDRDAVPMNGAAFTTDAAIGSHAIDLDGANDFVDTGTWDLSDEITVSAWVRIPSTSSALETVFANSTGGAAADGFKLFVYGANHASAAGRIRLETGNGTSGNPSQSNTGVFEFDQWNHLAITLDRAAGTSRIIYNRTDVTTTPNIRNDFGTVLPVHIGQMTNNSNTLVGQIDEVCVFGSLANDLQLGALGEGSPNAAPVIFNITSSDPQEEVGTSVSITASVGDANLGEILFYRFNFGDGSPTTDYDTSPTATHTYTEPGRYVGTVTVTDGTDETTSTFLQVVHHPLTSNPAVQSSTIAYDVARKKIWVVNPDNSTLARIEADPADPNYLDKDFEQATGNDPQSVALWTSGNEAWVTSRKNGRIDRFDLNSGTNVGTIDLGNGYEPIGICITPDQSKAFVACQGAEMVVRIDTATQLIDAVTRTSSPPRALSISGDSSTVFVTRFRSPDTRGEVWEIDASNPPSDTAAPIPLAFDNSANTGSSGRGVPNYLLACAITPDGRRLWVGSKKDNIAPNGGLLQPGEELTFEASSRSILSPVDLSGGSPSEDFAERIDVDDTGLPSSVVFSPVGDVMFAAFIVNNKVLAFDTANGNLIGAKAVGAAPDGLCLSNDGSLLFVHNFLSRSVTTLSIDDFLAGTSGSLDEEIGSPTSTVASEILTGPILNGKRVFYDAEDDRMAGDNYMSCASCHLNGDHDGRTWDFTARGEGLRNTTTLLGRGGMAHGVVHWSGNFDEIQDFELDIVNNFGGSGFINDGLNGNQPWPSDSPNPNAGRNADLDDLATYVASLTTVPDSPYRDPDGTLTTIAEAGKVHFDDLACSLCHSGTRFTDSGSDVQNPLLHDVGSWITTSGKRLGELNSAFDTPTLRGLWSTAPYLHDGRFATLEAFLSGFSGSGGAHDTASLTSTEIDELAAYLYEIDDREPAPASNFILINEDRWTQATGWKTVTHGGGFSNPIVICSPLTANGGDEAVVRVRNIGPDSFEYTVEEWEYKDGAHGADETMNFLVMNAGTITVDGKQITAGVRSNVTEGFGTEVLTPAFPSTPTVFAQIVSENEADTVTTRVRNIATGSFQVRVQEEEASADGGIHLGETVHYLVLEAGDYPSLGARVGNSPNAVTDATYSLDFGGAIGTGNPLFITGMQTTDGGDPCAIRWIENSLSNTGVDLFLQEENSDGLGDLAHTTEVVGWIVFGSP